MVKNNQTYLIIGVLILAVIVIYFCMYNKKSGYTQGTQETKEEFTSLAAGANDNVGMLLDDSYDLIQGADHEVPAVNFADMVNQGSDPADTYVEQPKSTG